MGITLFLMIALLIGVGLYVAGDRVFLVLLPSLGFIGGYRLGATEITNIVSHGAFFTVGRVLAGGVTGLGFALLAYLYWYASLWVVGIRRAAADGRRN